MTRTEAREVIMQAVFQMEIQKNSDNELFEQFLESKKITGDQESYIKSSFDIIKSHLDEIYYVIIFFYMFL